MGLLFIRIQICVSFQLRQWSLDFNKSNLLFRRYIAEYLTHTWFKMLTLWLTLSRALNCQSMIDKMNYTHQKQQKNVKFLFLTQKQ